MNRASAPPFGGLLRGLLPIFLLVFSATFAPLSAAAPQYALQEAVADTSARGNPAPEDSADLASGTQPEADTLSGQADSADTAASTSRTYEYMAHPILQLLTLPVDLILAPAVEALVYPMKDPVRYVLRNGVIDRTIDLISFGEKDQVMLYPTLNLAPGTGSYTGLTLRHKALFGDPDSRLVAMGQIYVNGDWKFRTYVTLDEMFDTRLGSKLSLQTTRVKNTSVRQPGSNDVWFYADSSNVLYGTLSHPLIEKFQIRGNYTMRQNRFGQAPPQEDSLTSDFFPENEQGVRDPSLRGLEKDWYDHILSVGLKRDTRTNQNIPLAGSDFNISANYHFTDAGHNYTGWEGTWTGYYKLGKERYEITSEEERKAGSLDIKKMLRQVEMKKLREQLLNRKVVILHAYAAQSFEVPGNLMPVYGLNTLGNDTPLRGYSGSRFRDYTILSLGGEYRFPLMRIMDGVIFNEYGVFGRSWDTMPWLDNLRNSWGFGVNVRRPDIFLFRAQLGFHGVHGILINLSVDTPY